MFGSGFPVLLAFLVQTRWLLRTIRLHHLVLVSISHHVFASLLSNFCFAASMGDSYDPGYEQDYSFATDHASLINNMIDSNCFDLSPQQASVNQDNLLCGTRSRHDSVNSRPSPRMPRYITGQHQAENQPCAVQSTPHVTDSCPYRSEVMSRATSHHSVPSSGQRYGGSPHFVSHHSFPNIWSRNVANMQRSQSAFSGALPLHSQHVSPHLSMSQKHQLYADSYQPDPMDVFATELSNTTHYSPRNTHLDGFVIGLPLNNSTDVSALECGIGAFGQPAG